jgi:hypothetical protein
MAAVVRASFALALQMALHCGKSSQTPAILTNAMP